MDYLGIWAETQLKTLAEADFFSVGRFTPLRSYKYQTDLTSDSCYALLIARFTWCSLKMGRYDNTNPNPKHPITYV